MVLMTAGNELDPVFDSLAPVIALTHALWDATMAEMYQGCANRAARLCTAIWCRQRTLRRSRCDLEMDAVDHPRARSTLLVLA